MFTDIYLHTTNPNLSLTEMFEGKWTFLIIFSVIFHTILYIGFFNLISYIFTNKILSNNINSRLSIIILLIMSLGYIGRFYHVKDIFNSYKNDLSKTRAHCDKLYISWLFIA
jgi:uncharacterized membrane protein (DUF485 family)